MEVFPYNLLFHLPLARSIYLHAAAYQSSDCKHRMLIIILSAYNRTPINNLVAAY